MPQIFSDALRHFSDCESCIWSFEVFDLGQTGRAMVIFLMKPSGNETIWDTMSDLAWGYPWTHFLEWLSIQPGWWGSPAWGGSTQHLSGTATASTIWALLPQAKLETIPELSRIPGGSFFLWDVQFNVGLTWVRGHSPPGSCGSAGGNLMHSWELPGNAASCPGWTCRN